MRIYKRKTAKGEVRWDVTVDRKDPVTGRRKQERKTFTTRKAAQVWLSEQTVAEKNGTAVTRSATTVSELLALWLQTHKPNVRPSTFASYEDVVNVHLIPALGTIPVQKLTPQRLQTFYNSKLEAGCGPRTLRLAHLHLSQALKLGVNLGLVPRCVTDSVTPPRYNRKPEMQTWDTEQSYRFLSVAHESIYGPLWTALLLTGMRRGEALGLRWIDVNWERSTLSIRQTVGVLRATIEFKQPKTKAGRRTIHIPSELLHLLKEHKARQNERRLGMGAGWNDHDLVFTCNHGGPIHPCNIKRDFWRLVKLAGVPKIRIHDLRHTMVTQALAAGVPVKVVSETVGHADVQITLSVYAHTLPEQHKEIAEKVADRLLRREVV